MGTETHREDAAATEAPRLDVAPSPHLADGSLTTRRMMGDVLLALLLPIAVAVAMFRQHALLQVALAAGACLGGEALFARMRGRRATLGDGSALVTGVILGLSLPPAAPWYVAVLGGFAAIGFGKVLFGGLGQNIFNPAMVGRAFVMIAFPAAMGAAAYLAPALGVETSTGATPLTALKMAGETSPLGALWLGATSGSVGETGALAALLGGLFLCIRRTASWPIPAGVLLAAGGIAGILQLAGSGPATAAHHLGAGALVFGAFFIATDPVTSPLTPKGKFVFGLGIGALVMLLRTLSGYPEGVMFSVLIMNALTPLINRATIPTPVGGPVPGAA